MLTLVRPCVLRDAFSLSFCLFISGSKLCYQVFLDLGKANISDLLAVRTENNYNSTSCGSCTERKLELVTDSTPPTNTFIFLGLVKLFFSSKVTVYKYWVSGILLQ